MESPWAVGLVTSAHAHIAAALVFSVVLTACCQWVIAKRTGAVIPIVDPLITRTTEAEAWPDTVLTLVGSNVVWLLARVMLSGWVDAGRDKGLARSRRVSSRDHSP